ncbi:MAG: sugar phosphate isomerase/epimerase [Acidobacteriota bacterium]|nr:MAG: sugar phosphate isomerase/epimerase [Acidobacteriota bacterium]
MTRLNSGLNRRRFLQAGSMFAVAAGMNLSSLLAARKQIPIGVQLYCVRRELAEDMEGTLAQIAAIGFQGVEFADYFGRSARELRALLDKNGLKCCGTHIMLEDMLGDKLEETIEFNQAIGNPYLIIRWLGEERRNSKSSFLKTVELINEVSANLEPDGMKVGYHNHDYIFKSFDGEMLWNMLADEADSRVILQLDTGNASMTGVDAVGLLRRNNGRAGTIHIKPYSSKRRDAFIGDDELAWDTIIELCEGPAGTEWYIVEYEEEGHDPVDALRQNYLNFKKLLS